MTEAGPRMPKAREIAVTITPDDWAAAMLRTVEPLLAKQRRQLLTVALPVVWIGLTFAAFCVWMTSGEPRSAETFIRDFGRLFWGPMGLVLGFATVVLLLQYAFNPWLVRRRVRRWLRREDIAGTQARHRFDEAGVTSEEPHRRSRVAWRHFRRLEDSETHLFLIGAAESIVPLPKSQLSVEERQDIIARAQRLIDPSLASPDAAELLDLDAGPDAVLVRYEQSEADRGAALLEQLQTPAARAARFWGFVRLFLAITLIMPVLFALGWVVDPDRVPFAIALPLYAEMALTHFWMPALFALTLVAVCVLVLPRLQRMQANAQAKALGGHDEPAQVAIALSESGVVARTTDVENEFDWPAFRRVSRGRDHLFLTLRMGSVMMLPLRSLDAAGLARVLALVHAIPGEPSGARKWRSS